MVMLENQISHIIIKHSLQYFAVTLKPSGIWRCGAANVFLTGKGTGGFGYTRVDIIFLPLSILLHTP